MTLKSFLTLPFHEPHYHISEGWIYSAEEQQIHGYVGHGGVDFVLPRGVPIVAAADGWALASYFWFLVKEGGVPRRYKGKEVGMGLGRFVQIWHPEQELFTVYGHLDSIESKIPFYGPRKLQDCLHPVGHKFLPKKMIDNCAAIPIKRGEIIGTAGDTGLTWDYTDYPERPNPNEKPSWDEVHLHFEVFQRVGSRLKKKYLDPYGINSHWQDYPDPQHPENAEKVKDCLWFVNDKGLPLFKIH